MTVTTTHEIYPGISLKSLITGHASTIFKIAWSPDGTKIASSSMDKTVSLWDVDSSREICKHTSHTGSVFTVSWSPDGNSFVSGGSDGYLYKYDLHNSDPIGKYHCPGGHIFCAAWSPEGHSIAIGSENRSVYIVDSKTLRERRVIPANSTGVFCIAWSPSGRYLSFGSRDGSIQIFDTDDWFMCRTLNGHSSNVYSLVWSPDDRTFASASTDNTVRIWDVKTKWAKAILEGHTDVVTSVSYSSDGNYIASKSKDNTVRIWSCSSWDVIAEFSEVHSGFFLTTSAFHPNKSILATLDNKDRIIRLLDMDFQKIIQSSDKSQSIHFINAKVVLVGESGVGKSGLGTRIAENCYKPSISSTHGARFWQIPLPDELFQENYPGIQAEITLWDLAGQPEYHLTHQLFLDDTDVSLLLFDCSDASDPFRGVPYWAKVLKKQAPPTSISFLVSSRCDVSPVTVDDNAIARILSKYELNGYVKTSALTGEGVEGLLKQIMDKVPWKDLPRTTTPILFQKIREYILTMKERGVILVSLQAIKEHVLNTLQGKKDPTAGIITVIDLLQAKGLIFRIQTSPNIIYVLLKPELINCYASSIIQAARNHLRGIGAVTEREVICGNIPFTGFKRLGPLEEKSVLEATVELFILHDLCFREMGMLVFPSQLNISRPIKDSAERPPSEVTYEFSGSIEAIYASLVVRLNYTDYFQREEQWKYAVEFSRGGGRLGFVMRQPEAGVGELDIYFYPSVNDFDKVVFIRFITEHLNMKGIELREKIRLYCPKCGREVNNDEAIQVRVKDGKLDIPCLFCDTIIIIPKSIEDKYQNDKSLVRKQRELQGIVEKRTEEEIDSFKRAKNHYSAKQDDRINILHLSDLHISDRKVALKYRTQLELDLSNELQVRRINYLIISGDIVNTSSPEEYDSAFEFVDGIVKKYGLDTTRVITVPGNHDLNWDISEESYELHSQRKIEQKRIKLTEGNYISAGDAGYLILNDEEYKRRFDNYNYCFHRKITSGISFPLEYGEQYAIHEYSSDKLLFLSLNSSWNIDHHFKMRSSINMEALSNALDKLNSSKYKDWIKFAVWHHPVTGNQAMDDSFIEMLCVNGFKVCLHGHLHESRNEYYRYDRRGINIIAAGTFGAPYSQQIPGIPLQYNLITATKGFRALTVYTRKKEKPDGAWSGDARWGNKNNPKTRYRIDL